MQSPTVQDTFWCVQGLISCTGVTWEMGHFSQTLQVVCATKDLMYMWQSCVEIEIYSIAYFDHIAAFKMPYH